MSIDVLEGDLLVVDSVEYPIKSAAYWAGFAGRAIRGATIACSTKRSPAISGGKRGEPAAHLTNLLCSPLDPVDPELRQRMGLDTPHELLQTFIQGTDGFVNLIVEELKR